MRYKGKLMRKDAVTVDMVAECLNTYGYAYNACDVYARFVSEDFMGKKTLEEAVELYDYYQEKKRRRAERKRIKAEKKAKRWEAFLNRAYHVYTDGSCDNVRIKVGGSGYVILKDGEVIKTKNKGFYPTTNNRMELLAIVSALNSLPDGSEVIVFTDSQYCIKVLDGYMHEKNQDLINLYLKISKSLKRIVFMWVKGHNGNKYNEMADELAFSAFKEKSERLGKPIFKYMARIH